MKILVAGTIASIHTGRFVSLLNEIGHDVRVFNQSYDFIEDEHLRGTTLYVSHLRPSTNGNRLERWPDTFRTKLERTMWDIRQRSNPEKTADRHALFRSDVTISAQHIRKIIADWRPDLVISLKMQNDGYAVSEAKRGWSQKFPPWLHFNWGTDIALFGLYPQHRTEHEPRIRALLEQCDFLIADCERDIRLAREFGFRGRDFGAMLATGGFDLKHIHRVGRVPMDQRRSILIKGRHWPPVSVGLNIVDALRSLHTELSGFAVKFMMCTPDVAEAVRSLQAEGLPVEMLERLPYDRLLAEFAAARATVAATNVDGTPLFLAESMMMGTVPVHSDLESVREWIEHGVNGLLFPADNVSMLRQHLQRVLADDDFCSTAGTRNIAVAEARMDRSILRDRLAGILDVAACITPAPRDAA